MQRGVINGRGAGTFNALAFAPDGTPTIAYRDADQMVLRVAVPDPTLTPPWRSTVVDSANSGSGLDLEFSPSGVATISYGGSGARLAEQVGGVWTKSTVDSAGTERTALTFDTSGSPWVLYSTALQIRGGSSQRLMLAHRQGTTWVRETVASAHAVFLGDVRFSGTTQYVLYGKDTTGDNVGDELRLASRAAGGTWVDQRIVASDGVARCGAGQQGLLAFGLEGVVVAHQPADCLNGKGWNSYLEFGWRDSSGWHLETVRQPYWEAAAGLALVGGTWRIGYPDGKDLWVATRVAAQDWTYELALTDDTPALVYNGVSYQPSIGAASFKLRGTAAAFSYQLTRYLPPSSKRPGSSVGWTSDQKFVPTLP